MGKALIVKDGRAQWMSGVPYAGEYRKVMETDATFVSAGAVGANIKDDGTGDTYGLRSGKKYLVRWDGKEYLCTAFAVNESDTKYDVLVTDTGDESPAAFKIKSAWYKGSPDYVFTSKLYSAGDESYPAEHSFSLSEVIAEGQEIDKRCLPAEEWEFTLEDGSTVVKKVVVAE